MRIERNQYSIPYPGDRYSAYYYGSRAWVTPGTIPVIYDVRPIEDTYVATSDDINEVIVVASTSIDGACGATIVRTGLCFIGSNDIDEADLMVAGDLGSQCTGAGTPMPFTDPSATNMGPNGRATFVHEFGHFFGFSPDNDHETETMSIMRQGPVPMTGGTPSSTTFPTDMYGVSEVYGLDQNLPNMIVSAHGLVPPNNSIGTLEDGTESICRGSQYGSWIRMYVGNKGNTASGQVWIQARIGAVSRTGGTLAGFTTTYLDPFEDEVVDILITAPMSAPLGVQSINIDVDPADSITETTEADNWTISDLQVNVVDCP